MAGAGEIGRVSVPMLTAEFERLRNCGTPPACSVERNASFRYGSFTNFIPPAEVLDNVPKRMKWLAVPFESNPTHPSLSIHGTTTTRNDVKERETADSGAEMFIICLGKPTDFGICTFVKYKRLLEL